jgi:cytochrome c biogenesis protein CcmG/thiol:disulfide interchange protein DsbE
VVESLSRLRVAVKAGIAVVVVSSLALLAWATLTAGQGSSFVAQVSAGAKPRAPGFTLPVIWAHSETWPASLRPALLDRRISLAELRGRPVVINFWASWCGPCRREIPLFTNAAAREHGRVAFIGVDVQDLTGDAVHFLPKFHVNYVSARDGSDASYRRYGLTGVPETFFLNRSGRAVVHVPGVVDSQTLARGLRAIP